MCPGFVTRCGVFPYLDAKGGVRRELRHPDDVLDPVSLATLKYAPVTIEHPPVMITPQNVGTFRKGHLTERVEVNRDMIDSDLIIEDQAAIDAIEKDGIRELSSGYDADVIEEEGVYEGTPYNYRQKNIRYNHVALVRRGRAGPEIRLRLDSSDAVMQDSEENTKSQNQQETSVDADMSIAGTKKVILLGREVDLPSDIADTIQDYTDRFDEMRARLAQLEEQNMAAEKDKKDVDISQKGVSPQVKVEQQTPDGRSAGGKTMAKPGTITGPVGKADDEEKEDEEMDAEEKEEKEKADAEKGEKEDGEEEKEEKKKDAEKEDAEAGLASLKKDAEEKESEAKKAKDKYDAAAAASMNKPEKESKGDSAAEFRAKVNARVSLERRAEKLVPYSVAKRFDSMTDREIMAAVIKHRSPRANVEGQSRSYLQSRFDSIVEALEEEGTIERQRAGKELLGIGGGRMDSHDRANADPSQARLKMVSESREMYKEPLSSRKK